jgi:small multidrug resistance family-3 protein
LDKRSVTIAILFLAAVLEVGGDTILRKALHTNAPWIRLGLFAAGGAILFAYGYTANAPAWDFSSLLGLYVIFFFVVAQAMSGLFFGQTSSLAVMIGGSLIAAGGCVITVAA